MKLSKRRLLNSAPVISFLGSSGTMADNKLQLAFEQLSFKRQLSYSKFKKQKGDNLMQVMFALIIWPLLNNRSISHFCGRLLSVFIKGGVNVLYDFLKKDKLPWRNLRMRVAKQIYVKNQIDKEQSPTAFVFDDSLCHRRGKKVEGSSTHFDHTINKHVQSHQILEMGHVSSKGYLPLDSQIVIGDKKAILRQIPFSDPDSEIHQDYQTALNCNKNEILREMLSRALKSGFKADYVLADAWFGNKGNISAVLNAGLKGIFRMKNSNLKYRFSDFDFSADVLFLLVSRHRAPDAQSQKLPWKTWTLPVELALPDTKSQKEHHHPVTLVFSVPKHSTNNEFALFLSTDNDLTAEKILEIYALRWGIEVYFKEVKQHMGYMKEQTGNYVCHHASIHLSAIRYLLFSHMKMQDGASSLTEHRNEVSHTMEQISFASLLWTLFKLLISKALDDFRERLGCELTDEIMNHIESLVREFLEPALQIDPQSLLEERRAEVAGIL